MASGHQGDLLTCKSALILLQAHRRLPAPLRPFLTWPLPTLSLTPLPASHLVLGLHDRSVYVLGTHIFHKCPSLHPGPAPLWLLTLA